MHNSVTAAIRDLRDADRRNARPKSSVMIGEWALEARPDGLYAIHNATGTTARIAVTPDVTAPA